jgi:hypothetical protein
MGSITTIYKLMSRKYLSPFLTGQSVRLATIAYYRSLETKYLGENPTTSQILAHIKGTGRQGIDDLTDGATLTYGPSGDPPINEAGRRAYAAALQRVGIIMENPNTPNVIAQDNLKITCTENFFIFCTSLSLDDCVRKKIREDSQKISNSDTYDVAVPIVDIGAFGNALHTALAETKKITGLHRWVGQRVKYINLRKDASDGPTESLNVFKKHFTLKDHQEYRFVFEPTVDDDETVLNVGVKFRSEMFGEPIRL